MTDRRTFILLAGATGLASVAAACSPKKSDKPAAPAAGGAVDYDKLVVINSLGGLDDGYGSERAKDGPLFSDAGIADGHASGVAAWNVTVSVGKSFSETADTIKKYDAFLAAKPNDFLKVLTTADILKAKADKKLGVIYGFQNSAMVENDAANVDKFAAMGVKIIQLTYNDKNQVGAGSLVPTNDGISDFGRQVIDRLNATKTIVDLSHSGQKTCLDAIAYSKRPICISHTGCAAVAANPRSKTDEELRGVAEKGGYVGIYFMPFLAPGRPFGSADIIAHIEHALNVCGEDHVGIGTDHEIANLGDLNAKKATYGKIVNDRRAKGISAPGEDPAILPYPTDMTGPDQFRILVQKLSERGHTQARIEKIMGGNFLRYAKDIWGA
jgi:membrane dipeptidase